MNKNILVICGTAIIISLIVQIPSTVRALCLSDNIMAVTGYLSEQQRLILAKEVIH